ncbi:hypothetical protein [Algoriphagus sp. CAU 1675]|uniref:hypothetical protein n=1 Tax=Algoriphagus sp. CAU 1675 TaxID=3032597 RepID=UPI0023DB84C1|nr:hypothetical protein [Algoriphagus sp. CAU 1675]MDF2159160.1 hypothetical protein [Algoriphagus sp. CAU 1675]
MKTLLKIGSYLGLVLTICPSVFYFLGKMELSSCHLFMAIGMGLWFVTAPFWINSKTEKS